MGETVIGRIVSGFEITAELGSGGMGTVYLAEEKRLNRRVAVKFLSRQYASDEDMKLRFMREAQAAAALNHPNVVPIYTVSEFEGRPFFAMEYIDGQALSTVITDGTLPWERILHITTQICEGLRAAHEAGIVHRDIKPANILIDATGRVRLVDFGLARRVADDHLTPVDSTIGTIAYTSPEQLQGEEPVPASDLFSVGAILYQVITGRLPFPGRYEAAVMYAIVNDAPPPVESLRDDVPPHLRRVVSRLLEKRIENRYQSAAEVLTDLRGESAHKPVTSGGSPNKTIRRRWAKYSFTLAFAIIGMVAGLKVLPGLLNGKTEPRKMLAVLPFENLGPPEEEYFSDGVTDAITTHLATFGDLGVISLSSSMQYKRSTKSVPQIGAELGADYLLMGTVQWDRSGLDGQSRISASLVKVEDGAYIWKNTYTQSTKEVFSLQSAIGQKVTRALKIAVKDSRRGSLSAEPTDDLEAYDLYLRGNDYFNRSEEQEDIQFAIDLYERAVVVDTGFAVAYAVLSRGHCRMYSDNYDRSERRLGLAEAAARKALSLDPDLPDAHLGLGYCYYAASDYSAALQEFQIVRDIQPNNRHLYNAIAAVNRRQGDLQSAVSNFLKALDLDPRSNLRAMDVGLTYGLLQEYDLAAKYVERAIMLAPDLPLPHIYRAWLPILENGNVTEASAVIASAKAVTDLSASPHYWRIARIVEPSLQDALNNARPGTDSVGYYLHCAQLFRLSGQHETERGYADSARSLIESQVEEHTDQAWFHAHLGLAYSGLRQNEKALTHGEMGVRLWPTLTDPIDAPFLVVNLAEICVALEEYDLAVDQLERLVSMPGFATAPYLKIDPLWLPLHEHPRFRALVQETL
jgi:serine/threonine protein kinase